MRIEKCRPVLLADLRRGSALGISGGVYENIDAAELLQYHVAQLVDGTAVADIGSLAQSSAATGFNFAADFVQAVLAPASRYNVRAVFRKADRNGASESRGRAH